MQVACAKGLIQLKEGEKSGRKDRGTPSLLPMVAFPSDTSRGQYWPFHLMMDFLVAQTVKCLPAMQESRFNPWVRKIPWRQKWQPTPILLPGEFHGKRTLAGNSPWGCKESDTTERLHFLSLSFFLQLKKHPTVPAPRHRTKDFTCIIPFSLLDSLWR